MCVFCLVVLGLLEGEKMKWLGLIVIWGWLVWGLWLLVKVECFGGRFWGSWGWLDWKLNRCGWRREWWRMRYKLYKWGLWW